jgi:serine/threonine protein kinase
MVTTRNRLGIKGAYEMEAQKGTDLQKSDQRSAHLLLGRELQGGWKVTRKLERKPGSTGGNFSVGYIVEANGKEAFLKAFDYKEAFELDDPAPMLKLLTTAYEFERDLLGRCSSAGMSRIVRTVDHGAIRVAEGGDPRHVVQYVIFELANGDVRSFLEITDKANLAWKFTTLREAATGLSQLHRKDVAHQDIKPSNVLIFQTLGAKLADLGRASVRNEASPYDAAPVAGAWAYAPPELLYKFPSPDWDERRIGCDLYLLGSLVFFFFTGFGATKLILRHLEEAHRPNTWKGYYQDALPFVMDAFGKALEDLRASVPQEFQERVVAIARQLCNPDISVRGHPRARALTAGRFSLERYISEFNELATHARIELRKFQ